VKRHKAKIIGGLLGLFFGGPFGAMIGFGIGYMIDKKRRRRYIASRYSGNNEAVIAAVTALGAKVAKSDGHVSQGEIRAFREAFNIRERDVRRLAALWRDAARTPAGYEPYARHLSQIFAHDPDMLRRILAGLRKVMLADGRVRADEQWALEDIARIFGVDPAWIDDEAPVGIALDLRSADAESMSTAFKQIFSNDAADADLQVFPQNNSAEAPAVAGLAGWLARPLVRDFVAVGAFLTAYVACMLWAPFDGLFAYSDIVLSMAVGALASAVARAVLPTQRGLARKVAEAAKAANVSSGEVADTIEQTRAKVAEIAKTAQGLEGESRRHIEQICTIARDIADNLIKEPGDVARSRPFLVHYLDATHDVVRRFADLRSRGHGSERFDPVFQKLNPLLADMEQLFRKHYERGLADEALELDVSIESLQRMVRSEQI
jgi:uncharacterized tellurite resistance protein B-like protein